MMSRNLLRGLQKSNGLLRMPTPAAATATAVTRTSSASFHTSRPRQMDIAEMTQKVTHKLQTSSRMELYHMSSVALVGLAPVAMILSPSILNVPVDLALNAVIPVHMYYGMDAIIRDYVPRPVQGASITAWGVLTALIALGLLKINLCGHGISESTKSLWRAPKAVEQRE